MGRVIGVGAKEELAPAKELKIIKNQISKLTKELEKEKAEKEKLTKELEKVKAERE